MTTGADTAARVVRQSGASAVEDWSIRPSGLFEDASNFEQRFVRDYARISEIVDALRVLGLGVVLTSGTFDILH